MRPNIIDFQKLNIDKLPENATIPKITKINNGPLSLSASSSRNSIASNLVTA
jgi:hypothetical protein